MTAPKDSEGNPQPSLLKFLSLVYSTEEAHDFILNHAPDEMVLVPCPCRTRTEKMGIRECKDDIPVACCIMMGPTALHFEMQGL